MRILTIKEGHDGNYCIFDSDRDEAGIYYFLQEREKCSKHLSMTTYDEFNKFKKQKFDIVAVSFGDLRAFRKTMILFMRILNA